MTARARRRIYLCSGAQHTGHRCVLWYFAHRCDPRYIASIDVDHTAFAIDRCTAPLSPSVESGQHHRPLSTRRREQPIVTELAKARERGCVRARGKARQVCFGDGLSREGRRRDWEGLGRRYHFAGESRRRHCALLDGKERIAGLAIEHEHEPALRDLRDSVYPLTTTREREEIRRGGEVAIPHVVVHGLEMPDAF